MITTNAFVCKGVEEKSEQLQKDILALIEKFENETGWTVRECIVRHFYFDRWRPIVDIDAALWNDKADAWIAWYENTKG